jgi:hypothetical protein
MVGIWLWSIDGANLSTLRRIEVAHAFDAFFRVDYIGRFALADGAYRAL